MYKNMLSANSDHFISSSPIWMPSIPFSCPTDLEGLMLNRSSKSRNPYLVLDLSSKGYNFSPLSMLALNLPYMFFIVLRKVLLYMIHLEFLSWMNVECCQMLLFYIYSNNHTVFLHSVDMVCHIHWFAYSKLSLHPRGKSYLIMVNDPFNVLLNLVC